jgi:hypothetical protein
MRQSPTLTTSPARSSARSRTGRRQNLQHPAATILLDTQVLGRRLAGRQHEVVVGRAADTQLRLRPVEVLTGRIEKFDTHESTAGKIAKL